MLLADSPFRVLGRNFDGSIAWLVPFDGLSALGATEQGELTPVRLSVRPATIADMLTAKRMLIRIGRWVPWHWSTAPAVSEGVMMDYTKAQNLAAGFTRTVALQIPMIEPEIDSGGGRLPLGALVIAWSADRPVPFLLGRRIGRNAFLMFIREERA